MPGFFDLFFRPEPEPQLSKPKPKKTKAVKKTQKPKKTGVHPLTNRIQELEAELAALRQPEPEPEPEREADESAE